MSEKNVKILEGKIRRDVFGSWDDCSPGLYIDTEMIETLFSGYSGRYLRVTIEEIDCPDEEN